MPTLLHRYNPEISLEAGLDEAGRGCLAGPVFAAAVILKDSIVSELACQLNDSKKLTPDIRNYLRCIIEENALAYAVAQVDHLEIDRINILNASIKAMHIALANMEVKPAYLIVDGNRFKPYPGIDHQCIVKGDGLYLSIAAASVLAKTYRDEYMLTLHEKHPEYGWDKNKGYPTIMHREAIRKYGLTPLHRKSFNHGQQLELSFGATCVSITK